MAASSMKHSYTQPLADEELRSRLEAKDTILFEGQTVRWQEIEHQVERLGFGDLYIVSTSRGAAGTSARINLRPESAR